MSLSASAQAGDKALGAQLVFGSETNSLGFGVKGQYYFTDHIRGEGISTRWYWLYKLVL